MPRDYRLYLDDILEAAVKIREYCAGMSLNEFMRDSRTFEAVIHNLTVIGEAANHIPESHRADILEIEWRKIIDMRNVLVHQYFGIRHDVIWDAVQNKVPALEQQVRALLERLGGDD